MKVWLVSVFKEISMQVAQTILAQLGGRRFLYMTGAKFLVGGHDFLMFKLPRAKNGINKVRIVLNDMDTYDVEAYRLRGADCHLVERVEGVYNDMLQEIFTDLTGLYTSL
jgi:hypothetical protein